MIWTNVYTGTNINVSINFADGIYKKVRSLVKVTTTTQDVARLQIASIGVDSVYSFDYNGEIMIDISQIVNTYAIGATDTMKILSGMETASISFTIAGLLNANDTIVPNNNAIWNTQPTINDQLVAALPSRWIISPVTTTPFEFVEVYAKSDVEKLQFITSYKRSAILAGRNNLQYNAFAAVCTIRNASNNAAVRVFRQNPLYGRRYAVVDWVSRFGGKKRHVWELVNIKEKVTTTTNILQVAGYPDERKASQMSFVLRLDNLTEFDYWYYADIVTSYDVRVWICGDDTTGLTFPIESRVIVTNTNYTLPNSTRKGELDIEVTWKQYQEV